MGLQQQFQILNVGLGLVEIKGCHLPMPTHAAVDPWQQKHLKLIAVKQHTPLMGLDIKRLEHISFLLLRADIDRCVNIKGRSRMLVSTVTVRAIARERLD